MHLQTFRLNTQKTIDSSQLKLQQMIKKNVSLLTPSSIVDEAVNAAIFFNCLINQILR